MDARKELARYGKMIHAAGFAIGHGGNISLRRGGVIFIKKKDVDMSRARTSDYLAVTIKAAAKGDARLSSETPLHLASYASRKDISAVIHAHSPAMVAVAARTRLLKSNSYEFDCVLGPSVPVVPFIKPGSKALAGRVSGSLRTGAAAVLLARHGAVSVGRNIEEAYERLIALERACLTFLYLSA